jgi:hypothetical protein
MHLVCYTPRRTHVWWGCCTDFPIGGYGAVNCIDQHIKTKADQVALIWEKDEPGQTEFITYHKLLSEVCRWLQNGDGPCDDCS